MNIEHYVERFSLIGAVDRRDWLIACVRYASVIVKQMGTDDLRSWFNTVLLLLESLSMRNTEYSEGVAFSLNFQDGCSYDICEIVMLSYDPPSSFDRLLKLGYEVKTPSLARWFISNVLIALGESSIYHHRSHNIAKTCSRIITALFLCSETPYKSVNELLAFFSSCENDHAEIHRAFSIFYCQLTLVDLLMLHIKNPFS